MLYYSLRRVLLTRPGWVEEVPSYNRYINKALFMLRSIFSDYPVKYYVMSKMFLLCKYNCLLCSAFTYSCSCTSRL